MKEIKSRIILKHDNEINWNKASSFIPKQGEVIIYDVDDNYTYERMKIGDGITNVIDLPFITHQIVGKKTEGTVVTFEDKEYTCSTGAEIFNDLSTNLAIGENSHAEGSGTVAKGLDAHAEGMRSQAIGNFSHAENCSQAPGAYAHSEGSQTVAKGSMSHVEGWMSEAFADVSHAEGHGTYAAKRGTHVQGMYNAIDTYQGKPFYMAGSSGRGTNKTFNGDDIVYVFEGEPELNSFTGEFTANSLKETLVKDLQVEDMFALSNTNITQCHWLMSIKSSDENQFTCYYMTTIGVPSDNLGKYAHIVGNGGSAHARSNAHTLDWDGNAWYAGILKLGGSSYDDASEVALKSDIDTSVNNLKNELLNGAGEAYDTLKELGELIDDNHDAIDALETIATNKADKEHTHSFNELEDKPFGGESIKKSILTPTTFTAGQAIDASGFDASLFDSIVGTTGGNNFPLIVVLDDVQYNGVVRSGGITVFDKNGNDWLSIRKIGTVLRIVNGSLTTGTHTIEIFYMYNDVKCLDEMYIPDSIARSANVMEKINPVGTGSFSMNRKANSYVGQFSVAEGSDAAAKGIASHAEGNSTEANGDYSHAEGSATIAKGKGSHAEGVGTEANGDYSHAEGRSTIANGTGSHVEGQNTMAGGSYSHAEGNATIANASFSHAEGDNTKAYSVNQHVQGKYNIEDFSDTYAHIVGNGVDEDNRSNAHTLDWNGNAWYSGTIKIGGTSYDDASEVALKSDIENIDLSTYETKEDSQLKYDTIVEAKADWS